MEKRELIHALGADCSRGFGLNKQGGLIAHVEPGGIAAELQLQPGDRLLAVNGSPLADFIDYLFYSSDDEELTLEVLKESGEIWEIELEKESGEPLGLSFAELVFDKVRSCANHCLFCFVHQLPTGQRASLYVKDDDYRLSFLQGNYITLTNLRPKDWERIIQWRLSPLYISVHAADPDVRQKLLGCRKAPEPIMEQLRKLAAAGITLHTQAVLCPGINDGAVLEDTIRELIKLWPQTASLAVVPVGLTGHRDHLFPLRPFTREEACGVLQIVRRYQEEYLRDFGSRFVFAADEWYILANQAFPEDAAYEDYLQLDNGVGLIRRFWSDLEQGGPDLKDFFPKPAAGSGMRFTLITGLATRRMWEWVIPVMARYFPGIHLETLPVENRFFGPTVSVTGLLGGRDIREAILHHTLHEPCGTGENLYLIPRITLKADQEVFLDGISLAELQESCAPHPVAAVPSAALSWLEWLKEYLKKEV